MAQFPVTCLIQPADQPPDLMIEAARVAESAGIEELWLWEDCFAASGIAPAAAILGSTQRIRVGIGLMPAPLRAPSLTAMEIASLTRMFPGRFLPGLGHGVLDWMAQSGVRVDSPLTLLREQVLAIRALLRGAEVTTSGRYVQLDRVRLRFPPESVPPIYIGGRGPKTLAIAAELADGVILDDVTDEQGRARPQRVTEVLELVGDARRDASAPFEVMTFVPTRAGITPEKLAETIGHLGDAGATRVGVFAGGIDGPPSSGKPVLDLVDILGAVVRR